MSELLDDITEKMYDIIIGENNVPLYNYTHLLNKRDWFKLYEFVTGHEIIDYEDPHEKALKNASFESWLYGSPSYIQPIRIIYDNKVCLRATYIFLNHNWFIITNFDKILEFIKSIAHELMHYIEYIEDKRYELEEQIRLENEYAQTFINKYPKYNRKIKTLLKKKQPDKFKSIIASMKPKHGEEVSLLPTKMSVKKFKEIISKRGAIL